MSRDLQANYTTKRLETAWARRVKTRDDWKCRLLRSNKRFAECGREGQLDGVHIYDRANCGPAKFADEVGISGCRECHDNYDHRTHTYEVRVAVERMRAAWDVIKLGDLTRSIEANKVMTIGDRP